MEKYYFHAPPHQLKGRIRTEIRAMEPETLRAVMKKCCKKNMHLCVEQNGVNTISMPHHEILIYCEITKKNRVITNH